MRPPCARSPRRPRVPGPSAATAAAQASSLGQPDLGPQPRLARPAATTAPATPPRAPATGSPSRSVPSSSYEHQARYARGVHLGDLHGDVVQPLVGEQQAGDPPPGARAATRSGDRGLAGRSAISTAYARVRAATSAGRAARTPVTSSPRPARHVDEVELRRAGPAPRRPGTAAGPRPRRTAATRARTYGSARPGPRARR